MEGQEKAMGRRFAYRMYTRAVSTTLKQMNCPSAGLLCASLLAVRMPFRYCRNGGMELSV